MNNIINKITDAKDVIKASCELKAPRRKKFAINANKITETKIFLNNDQSLQIIIQKVKNNI